MRYLLLCLFACVSTVLNAQNTVDKYDIRPGIESSEPLSLTEYNGRLYFYASDENNNQQIWSTDGSSAPVRTIVGGKKNGPFRHIMPDTREIVRCMVVLKDKLYFVLRDSATNLLSVYTYDGTNTTRATGIAPMPAFSEIFPSLFIAHDNKLYFKSKDVDGRDQLYSYNPANNTATRHTAFSDALTNSIIRDMYVFKNKIIIHYSSKTPAWDTHKIYEYNPANNTTREILKNTTGGNIDYHAEMNDTLILAAGTNERSVNYTEYGSMYYYTGSGKIQEYIRIGNVNNGKGFQLSDGKIFFYRMSGLDSGLAYADTKPSVFQSTTLIRDANGNTIPNCFWFKRYLNSLVFCSRDDFSQYHKAKLWAIHGVNPPVLLSEEVVPLSDDHIVFKGSLYYMCYDNTIGFELAKYTNAKLSVNSTPAIAPITDIYPNPTSNYTTLSITLQQPQTLHISITDAQGRVVYNIPARYYAAQQHIIQLPITQLAAGVYQYTVSDGSTMLASGKLVRE